MEKPCPYKNHPAYMDAHCAAFNAWPIPEYPHDQVAQQAADRGRWDGQQARDRALADQKREG